MPPRVPPRTEMVFGLLLALLLTTTPIRNVYAQQNTAPQDVTSDGVVAAEAFRAGEAAYARGDFEAAARSFGVAHRLAPHPHVSYNAGLAWQAAGMKPRAADAFAESLSLEGLSDSQRTEAVERLRALQRELGRMSVRAPPGTVVTLHHVDRRITPLSVHLPPGRQQLRAEFPDRRTEERDVDIIAGAEVVIDLTSPTAIAPSNPDQGTPPAPPQQDDGTRRTHLLTGFTLLGIAVATTAVSIGTGAAALDARDTFNASGHTDADAHSRAANLRTVTNVGWVLTGVLAATGGVVLLTAPNHGLEAAVLPGGGALRLHF